MALTKHRCKIHGMQGCRIIPSDIGKVSLAGVCLGWEPHSQRLQQKMWQNTRRNPTMQLLHKKFMPFCCFHAWISSEVPVAASWKKSGEERSVLSVLRRIKNVTLSDSLQGGHWLIEIMFMHVVLDSWTMICALFLFLQQSTVWKGKVQTLCKKLVFTRPSTHLNATEANDLGTRDSHHQLITIRRLIQSHLQLPTQSEQATACYNRGGGRRCYGVDFYGKFCHICEQRELISLCKQACVKAPYLNFSTLHSDM